MPSTLLGWDINDREIVLRMKVNTNHLCLQLVEISKPPGPAVGSGWGDAAMQQVLLQGLEGCAWGCGHITQTRGIQQHDESVGHPPASEG